MRASTVRGQRVPKGLPDQLFRLDLGFLRWYWHSCFRADFVSDDDLEHVTRPSTLRHYRLIVFVGHEEYVTSHVYDLIERYRDEGGNLAFLSANNFFYKVEVSKNTMSGRTRWLDLGRPEAALIGAQYVGWDESRFPNHPYRVVNTRAARWLFAGTGLRPGSRLGRYGIEIDQRDAASPPDVKVLAAIRNDFGTGQVGRNDHLPATTRNRLRRRRAQLRRQRPLAADLPPRHQPLEPPQRRTPPPAANLLLNTNAWANSAPAGSAEGVQVRPPGRVTIPSEWRRR